MTPKLFELIGTRKLLVAMVSFLLAVVVLNFTSDKSVMAKGTKSALTLYDQEHGRFPRKASFESEGGTSFPGTGLPTEMLSLDMIGPTDLAQLPVLPALGGSA